MTKTILITGSTDGIGLLAAKKLTADGHTILLHGRNEAKLSDAIKKIGGNAEGYKADLSDMNEVRALADEIKAKHGSLDILINNAGVLKALNPILDDGIDIRFAVNTFAPFLLSELLLPIISPEGRIINLSSAAQAPVDIDAMLGKVKLDEMSAYAQSKLAITIWTREWAKKLANGPVIVAVNPGSLLASKMVKEGFGVPGKDLNIGADILIEAALSDRFADASGKYFDNDIAQFDDPHPAALNEAHSKKVMDAIEQYFGERK